LITFRSIGIWEKVEKKTIPFYGMFSTTKTKRKDLILILADNGYPPVPKDEVFKEIFEQAENFKKYRDE
jgi:hypothetical protein